MSSTRATPAGGDTAAHPVLQARYQDDSRLFSEAVFSQRLQGILPRVSKEGTVDTGDAIRGIAIDPE